MTCNDHARKRVGNIWKVIINITISSCQNYLGNKNNYVQLAFSTARKVDEDGTAIKSLRIKTTV